MTAVPPWRDRRFLAVFVAILLVGTALRIYRLDVLPPGLAYDEAWEGIDGRRILDGARPIFLPDNNGREPAFAYTVAATIGVLGQTPLAVRSAAVLWGVLTIGAMGALGGALGGRRLAVAAAGLVALSYWPIHLSRVGLRPVALPPLEALGIGLLAAALGCSERPPRARLWLALGAGASLGLQLYTYLPGRLTLAVAAFLVLLRWRGWRYSLVAAVVAILIATPLGVYYLRHPEDWIGRASQVSVMNAIRTGADPVTTIGANVRDTLGALMLRGDMQARHDLPGRPIFDPWSFAFFVVGLVVAPRRIGWFAALTSYLWLGLMLIPAFLSDSAPHFLRTVGALPPLFLFAAVGLTFVVEWLAVSLRRPAGFSFRLAAIPLILTGVVAGRDYFERFADPAVSAAPFEADLTAIAARLNASRPTDPLVGPVEPDHPALRFLVRGDPPTTFPVQALPLRAGGDYFVRQREGAEKLLMLRAVFPGVALRPLGDATEAVVPPGTTPIARKPTIEAAASFGGVDLLGADASRAPAGGEMAVRLYWRADRAPTERLSMFMHLVDAAGVGWAQQDLAPGAGGYPTTLWRAGELVVDDWQLQLPPGIPPGDYSLRVGVLRSDGSRVPLADGKGDFAVLGPVRVERGLGRLNLYRLPLTERLERELSAGPARVELVGYRVDVDRVQAGGTLPVLLAWESRGPAPGLQVEVALGDGPRARQPVGGSWPTDRWQTAEFVQQRVEIPIPASSTPGDAPISLQLVGAGGERSDAVPLGKVRVENRPRSSDVPTTAQPIGGRFGDFAELVAFDPPAVDGTVKTALYWRALATPSQDYVVFLHLLGPGDRVVGQVDSPPAGGEAPTRSWLPGEVVRDERSFQIQAGTPPGAYRLEVGMYRADTGERVKLADGSGDRVLFGQVVVR